MNMVSKQLKDMKLLDLNSPARVKSQKINYAFSDYRAFEKSSGSQGSASHNSDNVILANKKFKNKSHFHDAQI